MASSQPVSGWRIELLGGLRARSQGRTLTRFRTYKTGVLLAYLAYYLQRCHAREQLIELLWPESDPAAGRQSLSQALSSLRHQLEPPGTPSGAVLVADRFSLRLHPETVTTDVSTFEQALRMAEAAEGAAEQLHRLAEAVEEYHGPLLADYYEEWVLPERERLAALFLQALRQLIALLKQTGDFQQALRHAHRAAEVEPLREAIHRDVMRLLAALGQPDAALRHYREVERRLGEELDVSPAVATQQLAREIATRAPNLEARAPGAATGERIPSPTDAPPRGRERQPVGTVTLLLVEHGAELPEALREKLHRELRRRGGSVAADAQGLLVAAFSRARDALAAALAVQPRLPEQAAPSAPPEAAVRMALHTGDAEAGGDYRGPVLHHAGRLLLAAHPGQILCSEETALLARRGAGGTGANRLPEARLTDLGLYWLRDLTAPDRLFQADCPELAPHRFPPPRAEASYAGNLPRPHTRFFGRQEELVRLSAILLSEETSLVTLTGPGGSGKTRVALQVAARLSGTFRGAVWFVPLADVRDPQLVAGAVAEALQLPPSPQVQPLEQIVELLSRQPSLLVLDNFEQLLAGEAAAAGEGARWVSALLDRVPGLTCLVTSRRRLDLAREVEFVLPMMQTPGETAAPEELTLYESVQLFIDRAQAVRPDFQVTSQNAAAVAELCNRLEGIPLAIELAASRVQVLIPAQLLTRLEQRFSLLASRRADLPERHRTLRNVIDGSYELLTPMLQRFYTRLSVFRGRWSVDAAEAVCEEPLALDLLAQLRECSLIQTVEAEEGIRFTMLETIREFGQEQLEASGEAEEVRGRHARFFLAIAEETAPRLRDSRQAHALELLEAEHDNLRAALNWTAYSPGEWESGLRLCNYLGRFWRVRGHLSEGRRWLALFLSQVHVRAPTRPRASAFHVSGGLAWAQGDFLAARTWFARSLEDFRALDDPRGVSDALQGLGLIAWTQGEFAAALELYEESLAMAREVDNRPSIASTLSNIGLLHEARGNFAVAGVYFTEALALHREIGDDHAAAIALGNLAGVRRAQGHREEARQLLQETLGLCRSVGDREGVGHSLSMLGVIALHEEQFIEAQSHFEESLGIAEELGHQGQVATQILRLGEMRLARGDPAGARTFLEQSLALFKEVGNRQLVGDVLRHLATVGCLLGQGQDALRTGRESLVIFGEVGDREGVVAALGALAQTAAVRHEWAPAAQLWGAVLAAREEGAAPLSPLERRQAASWLPTVRRQLGETAFTAAFESGGALTLEAAVALALEA